MGKKGEGAKYKFMIVEPNGKWMQEIADLVEQVNNHGCMASALDYHCLVPCASAEQHPV